MTGTVAAAALRSSGAGETRQGSGSSGGADADASSVDGVGGGGRAIDEVGGVIIPAVGVVVGDDDGGAGPELRLLDGVDGGDDEGLLVERIGVAWVSVLGSGGLEEADGRQVACSESSGEVLRVVLVVGRIGGADGGNRGGTARG